MTLLRSVILAGAIAAPVVACNGRVVSIGSNADKLNSVDPGAVSGSVGACPTGYQHPNICCSGGPSAASSCGAYVNKPFRPCESGSTIYPNPLTCCSLADGTCIDAPPGVSSPPRPPSSSCTYACPPAWWSATSTNPSSGPPGSNPSAGTVECCQTLPNGTVDCGGASSPPSNGTVTCPVGPPEPDDAAAPGWDASPPGDASIGVAEAGVGDAGAGVPSDASTPYDAGCGAANAGSPPPLGSCDFPCPDGWTADPSAPAVCCRDLGDGTRECFSQATGGGTVVNPQPSGPGPGGPPPVGRSCGGSAPGPDGGSPATCECTSQTGSHKYDLNCSDLTKTCSCSADGVVIRSLANNSLVCASPQNIDSMWNACAFPE